MKTLYVSEDGKKFEDKKECIAYEEKSAEEGKAGRATAINKEAVEVLIKCGGFDNLDEGDRETLVRMIDNDSINYSPPKTFTDNEIVAILDRIGRGE